MRVTAKPSRSTREVEIDVGSLAPTAEGPIDAAAPARANRATLPIAAAFLVVVAITAFVIATQVLDDSPAPEPSPTPTGTPSLPPRQPRRRPRPRPPPALRRPPPHQRRRPRSLLGSLTG